MSEEILPPSEIHNRAYASVTQINPHRSGLCQWQLCMSDGFPLSPPYFSREAYELGVKRLLVREESKRRLGELREIARPTPPRTAAKGFMQTATLLADIALAKYGRKK
jgi:hypothetical protein